MTPTSPGRPDPGTRARGGGPASSGPGRPSTPIGSSSCARTCWGDARERPGPHRWLRTASATGHAFPSSPFATRSRSRRCWRTISASPGGRRWWGVRWVACGCSSGVSGSLNRVERAVVIAVGAAATAEQIGLCSLQVRAIRADPAFAGGDYYDNAEGPAAGHGHRPRDGAGELSDGVGARPAFRPRSPRGGAALEGRALQRRVLPRAPGRHVAPTLRRQLLHRAERGDEPPRRRSWSRRRRRRPGGGDGPGLDRRHLLRPPLSDGAPARDGPACCRAPPGSGSWRRSWATTGSWSRRGAIGAAISEALDDRRAPARSRPARVGRG